MHKQYKNKTAGTVSPIVVSQILYIKKRFEWDICSVVIHYTSTVSSVNTLSLYIVCLKLFSAINWITRMSTMYILVYHRSQF